MSTRASPASPPSPAPPAATATAASPSMRRATGPTPPPTARPRSSSSAPTSARPTAAPPAPPSGRAATGAVTEDVGVVAGNLTTGGALTIADVDQGQSSFTAQPGTAGSSGYGSFTLDAAGNWTYTAADGQTAIQQLGAGQSITDSFTAVSSDGTASQLVTVTIHGTNDAPVLSAITQPASAAELANASAQDLAPISGTLPVSDLDVGDTFTASISGAPTLAWSGGALTGAQITVLTAAMVTGKLSFTAGVSSNGGAQTIGYTYDASAANLDFLAAGQTLTVTYAVQVSDGTATSGTQSLSFVVTGTNDAPVLSTTIPTSVNVSGGVQVSSFLNSTDLA